MNLIAPTTIFRTVIAKTLGVMIYYKLWLPFYSMIYSANKIIHYTNEGKCSEENSPEYDSYFCKFENFTNVATPLIGSVALFSVSSLAGPAIVPQAASVLKLLAQPKYIFSSALIVEGIHYINGDDASTCYSPTIYSVTKTVMPWTNALAINSVLLYAGSNEVLKNPKISAPIYVGVHYLKLAMHYQCILDDSPYFANSSTACLYKEYFLPAYEIVAAYQVAKVYAPTSIFHCGVLGALGGLLSVMVSPISFSSASPVIAVAPGAFPGDRSPTLYWVLQAKNLHQYIDYRFAKYIDQSYGTNFTKIVEPPNMLKTLTKESTILACRKFAPNSAEAKIFCNFLGEVSVKIEESMKASYYNESIPAIQFSWIPDLIKVNIKTFSQFLELAASDSSVLGNPIGYYAGAPYRKVCTDLVDYIVDHASSSKKSTEQAEPNIQELHDFPESLPVQEEVVSYSAHGPHKCVFLLRRDNVFIGMCYNTLTTEEQQKESAFDFSWAYDFPENLSKQQEVVSYPAYGHCECVIFAKRADNADVFIGVCYTPTTEGQPEETIFDTSETNIKTLLGGAVTEYYYLAAVHGGLTTHG
jgi:hypothetical protein